MPLPNKRPLFFIAGLLALLFGINVSVFGQIIDGPDLQVDSTFQDSTRPIFTKEVAPDTRRISPDDLFSHKPHETPVSVNMVRLPHYDKLDSLKGFVQTLGQMGKPYQAARFGFNDRHFQQKSWRNPVFNRYNVYVLNPETEVPHYDTKTQYLAMDYAQGSRSLATIDGILSRNINPQWNVTGYYQNRRVNGVYGSHETSHRSVGLGVYYRNPSRRYHLFSTGTFGELTDNINGGAVNITGSAQENTFQKSLQNTVLTDAQQKRIVKNIRVDQIFHLLGHPKAPKKDTISADSSIGVHKKAPAHHLSLRWTNRIEGTYQRLRDNTVDTGRVFHNFVSPYPYLDPDTSTISYGLTTTAYQTEGAMSYSFSPSEGLDWNLQAALGYEAVTFRNEGEILTDNRATQRVLSDLTISGINMHLHGEARRTSSSLFDAETYAMAEMRLAPRLRKDSLRRIGDISSAPTSEAALMDASEDVNRMRLLTPDPLQLWVRLSFFDQNPSFFQQYFRPRVGSLFSLNDSLKNSQLLHARGGISWTGNRRVLGPDTTLANFVSLQGFFSRAGRFIYYSPSFEVLQANTGESLSWVGVELNARYRFWKKFYAEADVTLQQGSTGATSTDLVRYTNHLPQAHGRVSLYYDSQSLDFVGQLRIGADLHFFSEYQALAPDVLSGDFYPTNYVIPAYPRLDGYVAFQVKRTYIWIRLIHLNELLLERGYYTTPFYPELERTFTFGVNWTFFD